jgi:GR25 family glycosyltransferase involved in LPS biosynthesis
MKYIVMNCAGREHLVENIKKEIPEVIVNFDDFNDYGKFKSTAWFNYQRGWKIAGDDACVQMDDDIVLTSNFKSRIEEVISQYPNDIIQFFSMRSKDLTVGTRYEPLSNFMMQQCYYLPKGVAKQIYEYSKKFYEETTDIYCPSDFVIANWGKINKVKYLIYCPSLVDHMQEVSKIDRRRSSKRQSKTFKK